MFGEGFGFVADVAEEFADGHLEVVGARFGSGEFGVEALENFFDFAESCDGRRFIEGGTVGGGGLADEGGVVADSGVVEEVFELEVVLLVASEVVFAEGE